MKNNCFKIGMLLALLSSGCSKNSSSSIPENTDVVYSSENSSLLIDESSVLNKLEVSFSHDSGFYDEGFDLKLSTISNAKIYYTLDCTEPNENSLLYSERIEIKDNSSTPNIFSNIADISTIDVYLPKTLVDKCVIIKAIAISEDGSRSEVFSKSFFIGYQEKEGYGKLPIISMILNPDDLFDYERGIYVKGKVFDESEHSGYPETYETNYTQKGKAWERETFFTYFNEDKSFEFEQKIGVRIRGGWSRAHNQKSFNLYARKDYDGNKKFKKTFFETETNQQLMLRSGGYRDAFVTKTRDSLVQDISSKELFLTQDSFPCIMFLNGEYWGVYNFKEKYGDKYINEHYGVDDDNVIIIDNGVVDEGEDSDIELYQELEAFFYNNDFSIESKYSEVANYIDVKEFAAYMATELYIGNIDWPGNNVKMWRAREITDNHYEDGVWHFMMYDIDDSMNMTNKCKPDSDPFINSSHWAYGPLDKNCLLGLMMVRLLENDNFKTLFKETFNRIATENFSVQKINEYLDDRVEMLKEPMSLHYKRFVSDDESKYNSQYFVNEIDKIRDFYNQRYDYAIKYLNEHIK